MARRDKLGLFPNTTPYFKQKMQQQDVSHVSNISNVTKTVIFNWPDTGPSNIDLQGGFDSSTPGSGNINFDLNTSSDVSPVTPSQTALHRKFTQNKRDIGQWIGATKPSRSTTLNLITSSSFCNEANGDDVGKVDSGIMCDSWQSLTSTSSHDESVLSLSGQTGDCMQSANRSHRFIKPVPKLNLEELINSPQVIKQSIVCSVKKCKDVQGASLTQRSSESDCEVMDVLLGEEDPLKFLDVSVARKTLARTTKRRKSAFSDVEPSDSSDAESISPIDGDDVELFSDVTIDGDLTSSNNKFSAKNVNKVDKNCDNLSNCGSINYDTRDELKRLRRSQDITDLMKNCRKEQDSFDFCDTVRSKTESVDELWSWNASSPSVSNERVYKHDKNYGLNGSSEKHYSCKRKSNLINGQTHSANKKSEKMGSESGRSLRIRDDEKAVENEKSPGVHNKKKAVKSEKRVMAHDKNKTVESEKRFRVHDTNKTVESGKSLRLHDKKDAVKSEKRVMAHDENKTVESEKSLRVHDKNKTVESGKSLRLHDKKDAVKSEKSVIVHAKNKTVESEKSLRVHDKNKTVESEKSVMVHAKNKTVESEKSLRLHDKKDAVKSEKSVIVHAKNKTVESGKSLRLHDKKDAVKSKKSVMVHDENKTIESEKSLRLHDKEKAVARGWSLGVRDVKKTNESGRSLDVRIQGKKRLIGNCQSVSGIEKHHPEKKLQKSETYVTVDSFLTSLQPKKKARTIATNSRVSHKNLGKSLDIFEGETKAEIDKINEIDDIANNYELYIE